MEKAYDAVVYGGGFRGVGAACLLAGEGKRTLLVEPRPSPGWEATWSLNLDLAEGVSHFGGELADQLKRVGGFKRCRVDAAITEVIIAKMLKERNVELLHYVRLVGARCSGESVSSLVLAGKSGQFEVGGRVFIDASENGILLRMCGVPIKPPLSERCSYGFLMASAEIGKGLPKSLLVDGVGVKLREGIWGGEAQVEYSCESGGVASARRMMPGVLKAIRSEVPALRCAMVASSANTVMPLGRWSPENVSAGDPFTHMRNLFSCGPWQEPEFSFEDMTRLVANRIDVGERMASSVSAAFPKLRPLETKGELSSWTQLPDDGAQVVVCGGGTAGALAAVASARNGADTILLEASTSLGGMGTGGAIHLYYHGVKGGLQDEVDNKVDELAPLFTGGRQVMGFHPEVKKSVLQGMCDEAGVRTEFEALVCGVETEPLASSLSARKSDVPTRRVRSVIVAAAEGQRRCAAEVVVDSTGDGDVAALAGCPQTFGRPVDGLAHSYSQPAGYLSVERGLMFYNFDAGYCDPTDPWDLTAARREGVLQYLRAKYEEKDRLLYIAPLIGLRNSRQIDGDYKISLLDEIRCSEFPDVVGYSYSHLDDHAFDYENESRDVMLWVWALGQWQTLIGCEIPYRSFLPKGVEGLLLACRSISMDNDAHYQLRMQRDMQRIGEAAGTAAAISVKVGKPPRGIDVGMLQEKLFKSGALSGKDGGYHCIEWKPEGLFAKENKALTAGGMTDAVKMLAERFAADGDVVGRLASTDPKERFDAAVTLALCGRDEAFEELKRCVKERRGVKTNGQKQTDAWKLAASILGLFRRRDAASLLEGIVDTCPDDFHALMHAVRALKGAGSESSVRSIENMLKRGDVQSIETLQVSCGGNPAAIVDSRWKLELAAAETLQFLGAERRDLVERHFDDPRGYVSRCALEAAERLWGRRSCARFS